MYQEDMMDGGDGNGGRPPSPRISIENSTPRGALDNSQAPAFNGVGREQLDKHNQAPSHDPYNHSALATDPNQQRQYHQYPRPTVQPPQPLSPQYVSTAGPAAAMPVHSPNTSQFRGRSRSLSRTASDSPQRRCRSTSRSSSSLSGGRRSPRRNSATSSGNTDRYHLMPLETEAPRKTGRSSQRSARVEDANERFDAQVSLWIQVALFFFCLLILVAVLMAVFSHSGYWVVIFFCLALLISLSLGLCCFLHKVLNEDGAPRINQKHMPKWYRTLTKIMKEEMQDFREDWMDMVNQMYLLEDGESETAEIKTGQDIRQDDQLEGFAAAPEKPKKKRGKSTLFKLVAKPAAVLASFRRKRKGKKKQKKGHQPLTEPTFPSTV